MKISLPDYAPPNASRANLAVGASPLLVLLAFTLLVSRTIEPDTCFAVLAACTVWVVYEMHDYQKTIDGYNAHYVDRHLAWRSTAALLAMLETGDPASPTRQFVERFIADGRVLRPDGALP